jgi:chromosome partitioning protein
MEANLVTVVSQANQKGGVGKSTSTINLARSAQRKGLRVLVYDADPQGNVTSALAATPLERGEDGVVTQATVADVLVPNARFAVPLREVIVPTIYGDGVDLAPAAIALASVEEMLAGSAGERESFLRRTLEPVKDDYDLVLIDCPPSLGLLTINALTASDGVLVISQAHVWSTDGMAELRRTITLVQRRDNPQLYYVGVLISMWEGTTADKATKRNKQALADIREHFPEARILEPFIPRRTHIGEAIDEGVPLDQWRTVSMQVIADDYGSHVDAIVRRAEAVEHA